MKKIFQVALLAISFIGAGRNAQAQIAQPLPPIVVTRDDAPNNSGPGSTTATLSLTLKKPLGGIYNVVETKAINKYQTVNYTSVNPASSNMTFSVTIDGQTSQNTYAVPTTVNYTTTILATDPGMTNTAGGYGYSVTLKCTGTNQYTVSAVKLFVP
ncbi:hypothetical protein ACTHGU_18335 [Chitinophagaceae bacterium MMS25-I14]